ncbi:MAG: NADP-dependent isocitrate dehydrogenase [Candidatus Eremiobacteraeota bacterium]|nr:NADP-dependent isocitrate dehydrogenase [Candidatus Eremiobacteraeota bacterium]
MPSLNFVPSTAVAVPVAIAHGDGIGPEIMGSVLSILDAAGARIEPRPIEIGERVYRAGVPSGIDDEALATLEATRVLLKAPITTPQGGGYKSLNVTIRKMFGLFANVRPSRALSPFVPTLHPQMDVVIVRENEEDVYGGIEHRQTADVTQCLKLITRSGSERIIRYAFEYARAHGRRRVSCFSKDNIMKITDGLFHSVFNEIAAEYPDLEHEHLIVDIGAAKLAVNPERFDVIVLPNLYGDILSDVAAELCGSVGMAGSANVGDGIAMFEAIHGSAPDIAGTGIANPSGLLNAAVMMLSHVGQTNVAKIVQDAWLCTIEEGLHTRDIYGAQSLRCLPTREFAAAVIDRLGRTPQRLLSPAIGNALPDTPASASRVQAPAEKKERIGVDIFLDWSGGNVEKLAAGLQSAPSGLTLKMITNRGTQVWPRSSAMTRCVDHWRCRFVGDGTASGASVVDLLAAIERAGFDIIKTEGLYTFNGVPGFSLGQGQ